MPETTKREELRLNPSTLDNTFAALADPTRRTVVNLLRRGPLRAGEVATALGASPAGLSRHLRVLRESGLVSEEPLPEDGRVKVLTLRRAPFEELRGWVSEVEEFWGDQLASFKAHAERTRSRKRGRDS